MAQNGTLAWYWVTPQTCSNSSLGQLLSALKAGNSFRHAASWPIQHAWEQLVRAREGVNAVENPTVSDLVREVKSDIERHGENLAPDQLTPLISQARVISADIVSPIADQIAELTETQVAESIRGDASLGRFSLQIGAQDLFETMEHEDGHLFDTCDLSVRLHGYGWPRNWAACRVAFLQLSPIVEIELALSEIFGVPKRVLFWH